jgi:DNA repair protein RadC
MTRSPAIKEMPPEERPRERCMERGPAALSNTELLAILIRTGNRGTTAIEMASRLLSGCGSLRGLAALEPIELSKREGLGPARATQIAAALELARRFAEEEVRSVDKISGAEEAFGFLKSRLRDLPYEVFAIIFLNQKHGILGYREMFRGTLSVSSVHPREVVKSVLKFNAAALILAHNHPSGDVKPSRDDERITGDLRKILSIIDVRVLDHLVIGGNGYFSFAREGLL